MNKYRFFVFNKQDSPAELFDMFRLGCRTKY
jgi:hypothetical protein